MKPVNNVCIANMEVGCCKTSVRQLKTPTFQRCAYRAHRLRSTYWKFAEGQHQRSIFLEKSSPAESHHFPIRNDQVTQYRSWYLLRPQVTQLEYRFQFLFKKTFLHSKKKGPDSLKLTRNIVLKSLNEFAPSN